MINLWFLIFSLYSIFNAHTTLSLHIMFYNKKNRCIMATCIFLSTKVTTKHSYRISNDPYIWIEIKCLKIMFFVVII